MRSAHKQIDKYMNGYTIIKYRGGPPRLDQLLCPLTGTSCN